MSKFTGIVFNPKNDFHVDVDIYHDGQCVDCVCIKNTEAEIILDEDQMEHVEQQIEEHLDGQVEEQAYYADVKWKYLLEEGR